MRLFLFLFIIFSCSVFAAGQPAKVVQVIPVKFNGKGLHAPLPYNQQMMQRGWASVPAIAVPLSGGTPRYQPVRIAKPNLMRSLSKYAHRFANMSPAGKVALAAYGAYEANCTSQLFTSLCIDGTEPDPNANSCPFGTTPMEGLGCSVPAPIKGTWQALNTGLNLTGSGTDPAAALNDLATNHSKQQATCQSGAGVRTYVVKSVNPPLPPYNKTSYTGSYKMELVCTYQQYNNFTKTNDTIVTKSEATYTPIPISVVQAPSCPPDEYPDHRLYVATPPNGGVCIKPFESKFLPAPITPEWLDAEYAKNPNPINDSDIGLDDFVDWETGAPYPDLFDNPTFDPVSPAFADAAESIANGTVQSTNPNAPHYVPAEMMPNLLIQINNWHEGNTFTDIYTGKTITPEAPPPEETPIDWSKFPGITKAQYEASNNAWGNQAVQGQNIQTELDKLTQEQQKLTDFIETPLPDFAGQPKLLDFVTLPTGGGCRGFTLSVSLQGQAKQINVDQHCPPYNDWGQPVVSWLLSIYTLLLCFRIFHRTLEVS